jgi:hypothetical protein
MEEAVGPAKAQYEDPKYIILKSNLIKKPNYKKSLFWLFFKLVEDTRPPPIVA